MNNICVDQSREVGNVAGEKLSMHYPAVDGQGRFCVIGYKNGAIKAYSLDQDGVMEEMDKPFSTYEGFIPVFPEVVNKPRGNGKSKLINYAANNKPPIPKDFSELPGDFLKGVPVISSSNGLVYKKLRGNEWVPLGDDEYRDVMEKLCQC